MTLGELAHLAKADPNAVGPTDDHSRQRLAA